MRRVIAVLLSLAALITGLTAVAVAPPAAAQVPRDDLDRGLIYSGLRRAGADSPCRGGYEVVSRRRDLADPRRRGCTHGPDPVPAGVDLRPGQDPAFSRADISPSGAGIADGTAPGTVGCYGNGTDGYRVQLMYAREATSPDRYGEYEARFRQWAAAVDDIFNASAAKTGGIRHVRYVTDSQCRPVIERITLPAGAVNDFSDLLDELDARGIDRVDRKYLIWVDTSKTRYCGIASTWDDFNASATPGVNANNGNSEYGPFAARIDTRCWGQRDAVEAHELLHTLGGVLGWSSPAQAPPHATSLGHCTDESDRLCYADGDSGVFKPDGTRTSMQFVCPGTHEVLLDCGNDDYFSTNPPAGSWLTTHWNTANSAWLARGPGAGTTTSTVAGSSWYSDGTRSASGPSGTSIKVYATNGLANVPYQLVTGRNGVNAGQPCALDLVVANAAVVYAGSNGVIGRVTGTVNRLPGTYQVCFAQIDPVSGSRAVTGVVSFTVT
ncbi:MAG TPA: hypothetical protein VMZ73_07300 [Acidimicrobiales bacterium]|nr:hypothetical protein [Acidimicrobiales bacterium]